MKKSIERDNMDFNVNPGVDFYEYANGGWRREHPLEKYPEYSRYGKFDALAEDARKKLRELVENVSEDPDSKVEGTDAQKVADLYRLAGDMERRNREGGEPIKKQLEWVDNYDIKGNMAKFQAECILNATSNLINFGVAPDPGNSDMNILYLYTAGTHLGDRDYYLVKSERNDKILEAFHKYTLRILILAGIPEERAERIWQTVLEIDTEIARHQRTREENRNPELRNNIRTLEQIKEEFPDFDWDTYLNVLGVNITDRINVTHPEFITFLTQYINGLPEEKLRDYAILDQVSAATSLLSEDFEKANFEFSKVISGAKEEIPRWRKTLGAVNGQLPDIVGRLYVSKYFPEENKREMMRLVENLRKALGEHIDALSWMSEETKKLALEKLSTMKVKIGYPDKWEDFSKIVVDTKKSLAENTLRNAKYWVRHSLDKAGKPVDKEEWHMSPQTVNAYYSPQSNEICFPAAILQAPYFDINADDALNYGAIGVVIGHEMTHGFDDSGRKYDAQGNQKEWWSKEDADKFNNLADRLVEQFDKVEIEPGLFANGRFTLGENIADQGGLRIALSAYINSLRETNPEKPEGETIDGFTPLQRFYLSYAGVWGDNIREELKAHYTQVDPHSLGKNRVNITLRNIGPFFEAFGIKEGDEMWLPEEERVVIW